MTCEKWQKMAQIYKNWHKKIKLAKVMAKEKKILARTLPHASQTSRSLHVFRCTHVDNRHIEDQEFFCVFFILFIFFYFFFFLFIFFFMHACRIIKKEGVKSY